MIRGVGIDLVEISRIAASLQRFGERFAQRVLAPEELPDFARATQRSHFLAKRFAAKEALVKAMGTGFRHGLSLRQIYGSTEVAGGAVAHRGGDVKFETLGVPLPGAQVKLSPEGEILINSPGLFLGYHKNPEATEATLWCDENGARWLRTGDVGELDEEGFLRITDRKKDILVTAGGKNVAPQNIENDLKTSKYVSQALVVGDRRPYVAALLTLEPEEIRRWAAEHGLEGDVAALAADPRVHELLQGVVDEANRERSRFEQVKRFVVLPRDFAMEHGEVTPTLKLRRRAVIENFQDAIDELYSAEGPRPD